MRNWRLAGAALLLVPALGGCGLGPGDGGPQLAVTGPSDQVQAFVRRQGAHVPTRATTFPEATGDGQSRARVLMPAGTSPAAMASLAREAGSAGLTPTVIAAR